MRAGKAVVKILILLLMAWLPAAGARTSDAEQSQASVSKRKAARQAGSAQRHGKPAHKTQARKKAVAKPVALSASIARANRPGHPASRLSNIPPVLPPPVPALPDSDLATSLLLSSNIAFALDVSNGAVLFEKNADQPAPIASIAKLMTALVVMDARQDMDEMLEVTDDDVDHVKNTRSRLHVGARLSRADMLRIALMSSENRAASALGRNYPGGVAAFVAAMNAKAAALGMTASRYVEPTGLSSDNVASARDLARLVLAARAHPLLGQYSTQGSYYVYTGSRIMRYVNSNRLVGNEDWEIGLQKTGYISEAGRCLAMHVNIDGRPVVMVFLDSRSRYSRADDAGRLRRWLADKLNAPAPALGVAASPG